MSTVAPTNAAGAAYAEHSNNWRKVKQMSLKMIATHHVALANKVGVEPTGEDLRVAQVLHGGLQGALSGETGGSVLAADADLFRQLRQDFGIDPKSFRASVELAAGRKKTDMKMIPTKEASGKSKSFFFLSPDQHYLFKSATAKDVKTLRSILSEYIEHVKAHKDSMLPRYVALFRVSLDEHFVDFICMTNAFGGVETVDTRFDLKGSTYKRLASAKEKAKKTPTLKDGDWVSKGCKLPSGTSRDRMMEALAVDSAFLARRGLIDYSLLVGVHRDESKSKPELGSGSSSDHIRVERTPGLFVLDHWEDDGSFTRMYIALVDILTPYGLKKYAETFFLSTLRCGVNISCQPPQKYARRFMEFMRAQVMPVAAPAAAEGS